MPQLTKELVVTLPIGTILYHRDHRNSDGTPCRGRINGRPHLWKTRPDDFKLPMKHGFKMCFYIYPKNADEWFTVEDEAILAGMNYAIIQTKATGQWTVIDTAPMPLVITRQTWPTAQKALQWAQHHILEKARNNQRGD